MHSKSLNAVGAACYVFLLHPRLSSRCQRSRDAQPQSFPLGQSALALQRIILAEMNNPLALVVSKFVMYIHAQSPSQRISAINPLWANSPKDAVIFSWSMGDPSNLVQVHIRSFACDHPRVEQYQHCLRSLWLPLLQHLRIVLRHPRRFLHPLGFTGSAAVVKEIAKLATYQR